MRLSYSRQRSGHHFRRTFPRGPRDREALARSLRPRPRPPECANCGLKLCSNLSVGFPHNNRPVPMGYEPLVGPAGSSAMLGHPASQVQLEGRGPPGAAT